MKTKSTLSGHVPSSSCRYIFRGGKEEGGMEMPRRRHLRWVLKREEGFAQVSCLGSGKPRAKAISCLISNSNATKKELLQSPL